MKFYKVKKSLLKWTEMPQTSLKLKAPLLIDKEYNVLLGNCFKDRPNEYEIVIIIDVWPYYLQVLPKLEKEIFDSKECDKWLYAIDKESTERRWYAPRGIAQAWGLPKFMRVRKDLFDLKGLDPIFEQIDDLDRKIGEKYGI
ncbi:MAG: hypothetical protein J6R47_05235 [Acholeplasmatales bacterium]|nr:hypothetical protein [Acholeplasmatales bacterium]